MGDVWYALLYHVVWTTKCSQPTITWEIARYLHPCVKAKTAEMGCYIHACYGAEDHVHVAITIPPHLSVSDVAGQIKGASAHHISNQ